MTETTPATRPTRPSDEHVERVKELAAQAKNGDRRALTELRQQLRSEWPFWREVTDLQKTTIGLILNMVCDPGDGLVKELFSEQTEELRRDLAGSDPSPLEQLLASQVAFLWLQSVIADRTVAAVMDEQRSDVLDVWSTHAERASRKLQAAVRTLALVRRLAAGQPLVQQTVTTIERTDSVHIGGAEMPAPMTLAGHSS